MTIGRTAMGTNTGSSSAQTITKTSMTFAAGDVIVVAAGAKTGYSVTGVTWGSEALTVHETSARAGASLGVASKVITTGGTQTVTATFGGYCEYRSILVVKLTNCAGYDKSNIAGSNFGSPSVTTSTTSYDDEIVLGFCSSENDQSSWSNDTTTVGQTADNAQLYFEEAYDLKTSTAAMTSSCTVSSNDWTIACVTFYEAPLEADAGLADADADAKAATVTVGEVEVSAAHSTASATAYEATVEFSHPPVKYYAPYTDSGTHLLPKGLTLNSSEQFPLFRYLGPELKPDGYGTELVEAGSGSDMATGQLPPFLGSQDGAVKFNAGKYLTDGSTSAADVTTHDLVPEMFLRFEGVGGRVFAKRHTSPSNAGYIIYPITTTAIRMILYVGGSSVTLDWTGLVVGKYYYLSAACNRDENAADGCQSFVNGVQNSQANWSTLSASATNTGNLCVGGSENYATYLDGSIAYIALYAATGWLQTGSKTEWQEVFEERFWKAAGIWPKLAQGTEAPDSFTRDDPATLEVLDAAGNRRMLEVGPHWPRVGDWQLQRGYLPEPAVTELLPYTDGDSTTWGATGGSIESTPTTASPMADEDTNENVFKEDSASGAHYVNTVGTVSFSNGYRYVVDIYLQAISSRQWYRLYMSNTGTPGGYFDIVNGVTGNTSGIEESLIEDKEDGWYRCRFLFSESGGLSRTLVVRSAESADESANTLLPTHTGSGANECYFFGGNVALSNVPLSYRRNNSGTTFAVAADVLKIKTDDGNIGGVGSDKQLRITCDFALPDYNILSGGNICLFTLSDGGSSTEFIACYAEYSTEAIYTYCVNSSAQWATGGTTDPTDGEVHQDCGVVYKPNYAAVIFEGSIEGTPDTLCTPPTALDTLHVGSYYNDVLQLGGPIANLIAWQELEAPAGLPDATGDAPNATVSPGTASATAGLAEATGDAPQPTVDPGAVQVTAGLVESTGDAKSATVDPGEAEATAGLPDATGEALDATVAPGAVQATAGLTEATGAAPNAGVDTVSYASAQAASATGTALSSTVQPGEAEADAELPSATGTAHGPTVAAQAYATAGLAEATGTARQATVSPGEAEATAGLAEATANTVEPAVDPGAATADASLAEATGSAPDAGVDTASYATAGLAEATASAAQPTVSPGATQATAGLAEATGTATAAGVSTVSYTTAGLAEATANAAEATASPGETEATAGLVEATANAREPTVDPGGANATAGLPIATGTAPDAGVDTISYADAGLPSATGTAVQPAVDLGVLQADAEICTASANAVVPTVTPGSVSSDAAHATASADAAQALASTGEAFAPAGLAEATATAAQPTIDVGAVTTDAELAEATANAIGPTIFTESWVTAGLAEATGNAVGPAVSPGETQAAAGLAEATGTALGPSIDTVSYASAGLAEATGAALGPAVQPGAVTATAGLAEATATSHGPDVLPGMVSATVSLATATGTALQPAVTTPGSASAQLCTASANAVAPTVTTGNVDVTAGLASTTGTAAQAGVQPGVVQATAGLAEATANTYNPTVTTLSWATAGLAEATANGLSPTVQPGAITAGAGLAEATANAIQPDVSPGVVQAAAGLADATGRSFSPTIDTSTRAYALLPQATATALGPSVTAGAVTAGAGLARATATSHGPAIDAGQVQVSAALARATGSAPAPTVYSTVDVSAALATATAEALTADVQAGAVQTAAALARGLADSFTATVDVGEILTDAALASATATALDAAPETGTGPDAHPIGPATATATAHPATVLPGETTAQAELPSAQADALPATSIAPEIRVDAVATLDLSPDAEATLDLKPEAEATLDVPKDKFL